MNKRFGIYEMGIHLGSRVPIETFESREEVNRAYRSMRLRDKYYIDEVRT